MSHRAIRRVFQGGAMAAAFTLTGLMATESVAAQQPIDDPAQRQPVQDQDTRPQEPLESQAYQTDEGDDDSSWGWLGLLGLAGLLGLRHRDDRDARPVSSTTRRTQP